MQRIVVIGMVSHGNFGDDLISLLLVRHLFASFPHAQITILEGTAPNPLHGLYPEETNFLRLPWLREPSTYRARANCIRDEMRAADLVVIGGGGLFQDTHSRFNPHVWMRWLQYCNCRAAIVGLGLGFGPLQYWTSWWYLKRLLGVFDQLQVRDEHSRKLLRSIGFDAIVGPDVVAGSGLELLAIADDCSDKRTATRVLGCSLRPGPWLSVEQGVDLVLSTHAKGFDEVALFVFEHRPDSSVELAFNERVMIGLQAAGVSTALYCYGRDPFPDFWRAMMRVNAAIATRFHANIVWQKIGVPVSPVPYAPKVSSLYEKASCAMENLCDVADCPLRFFQISLHTPYCLPALPPHRTGQRIPRRLLRSIDALALINRLFEHVSRRVGCGQ